MSFRTIENLKFDNLALRALPVDPILENYPRSVKDACFSIVNPTPVKNPQTVVWSQSALNLLELDEKEPLREDFSEYFSGNKIIPGSRPAAHCYCGHQFGYFSGQLGDGATMYLGEVINSKDERWEIQFKGAGKTPYSRTADGRKVLRSSLREFLCSEAMYHLGVPTTRAGTTVTSDTTTERDIFYTGNVIDERCTIILRIAQTFIRFGSFEIFKSVDPYTGRKGPSEGNVQLLSTLTNYCIDTFYPEITERLPRLESEADNKQRYEDFFFEVLRRTARLAAHWQCVGFCHGVLNTDNMSIIGVTIDYGPFGFLEYFNPDFICNSSDDAGRYSYANQPSICLWNCEKLAEALSPLVKIDKRRILQSYQDEHKSFYFSQLRKKFGLFSSLPDDDLFFDSFQEVMTSSYADWTNVFRSFLHFTFDKENLGNFEEILAFIVSQCIPLDLLIKRAKPRIPEQNLVQLHQLAVAQPMVLQRMGVDPELIFAEWRKREAYQLVAHLDESTLHQKNEKDWRQWLTSYVDRVRKEMANVSEADMPQWILKRQQIIRTSNPKYILRNWIAQKAITSAEQGDFNDAKNILNLLSDPYALNQPDDSLYSLTEVEKGFSGGCSVSTNYCSPDTGIIRVT